MWQQLLWFALAGFMIWFGYKRIKGNPELFSGENLSKSAMTLGVLALFLIGVIAFCVMILKGS